MTIIDIPAIPVHPGTILQEEFLDPFNITQVALAKHLNVPVRRINEICRAKRAITPQTAWLLSQAFGTTPQFWLNGQAMYELSLAKQENKLYDVAAIV